VERFSPTRLRSARQAAQLRTEELALAVDRSNETIRSYELGRVDPPVTMVAALAEALGCRPGDLFADTDPLLANKVAASRAAQGLPPKITDTDTLSRIATVAKGAGSRRDRQ
jgi:transcriptional regulator with XRE-family HTH domain